MLCELTVKVGEVTRTSTTIQNPDRLFEWNVETPYDSLVALTGEMIDRAISNYQPRTERIDRANYMRPSSTAAQKDFVPLTAENFRATIAIAQANHTRRKKHTGPLVCDFFAFVVKARTSTTGSRRATRARVVAAADAVEGFLEANPDVQLDDIARTHLVLTHARQPDTATFRQMRYLDAMRGAEGEPDEVTENFKTIPVRINGSSELQLTIDVRELRAALGLPNYNVLTQGIFHSFVPPPPPEEDMEDVDHMSDIEEN